MSNIGLTFDLSPNNDRIDFFPESTDGEETTLPLSPALFNLFRCPDDDPVEDDAAGSSWTLHRLTGSIAVAWLNEDGSSDVTDIGRNVIIMTAVDVRT